jgi:hypothetical protein
LPPLISSGEKHRSKSSAPSNSAFASFAHSIPVAPSHNSSIIALMTDSEGEENVSANDWLLAGHLLARSAFPLKFKN